MLPALDTAAATAGEQYRDGAKENDHGESDQP